MDQIVSSLEELIGVLSRQNNTSTGTLPHSDWQAVQRAKHALLMHRMTATPVPERASFTFPGCPHKSCQEMPKCMTLCRRGR